MTPEEKLQKIKDLLPKNPSSIIMDIETVSLINQILFIIEYDGRFVATATAPEHKEGTSGKTGYNPMIG